VIAVKSFSFKFMYLLRVQAKFSTLISTGTWAKSFVEALYLIYPTFSQVYSFPVSTVSPLSKTTIWNAIATTFHKVHLHCLHPLHTNTPSPSISCTLLETQSFIPAIHSRHSTNPRPTTAPVISFHALQIVRVYHPGSANIAGQTCTHSSKCGMQS
jgi:hypothetical protein